MPVPDYPTMMLPVLESLADGQPRSVRAVAEAVAKRLKVSEEERAERIPSGGQTKFHTRISWIGVHFVYAQLITRPERGQMQITPRGLEVLKSAPARGAVPVAGSSPVQALVSVAVLMEFMGFMGFMGFTTVLSPCGWRLRSRQKFQVWQFSRARRARRAVASGAGRVCQSGSLTG